MIKQLKYAAAKFLNEQKSLKDTMGSPFSSNESLFFNNGRPSLSYYSMFAENPCVNRSIAVIASSASSIKFNIFKNDELVEKHVLYDLFNQPNETDSWITFVESLITNFMIYGNAYVALFKRDKFELHNLQSDKMKIVPGEHGLPKEYVYSVDGRNVVFGYDDTLPCLGHVKTVNPVCPWYGRSPLECVKLAANLHHNITVHTSSLLQNGGRVGGIVSLKRGPVPLTEGQKQDIKRNLIEQYQGPHNAGRIAIVEGEFGWTPMAESAHDMDFANAKVISAREICEALGVPIVLVYGLGISGDTKASVKEIVDRFHEGTVLPIVQKMFSFLNNFVVAKIAPGYQIRPDLGHFLPLHGKRVELWGQINNSNFLSDDEKRALLGLDRSKTESIMAD